MKIDTGALRSEFPCSVPVFPLPGSVLFPGALLPLHVFEPRYRTMVNDAVAQSGLIAIGVLAQCTQAEYRDHPPFHDTVCVGHVLRHEPLSGGRSNIVLLGVSVGTATARADEAPYRTADVVLTADRDDLADKHADWIARAFSGSSPGTETVEELREYLSGLIPESEVNAGVVGACAISAKIPAPHKLELLREPTLSRRLEMLVEFIERPWQWN